MVRKNRSTYGLLGTSWVLITTVVAVAPGVLALVIVGDSSEKVVWSAISRVTYQVPGMRHAYLFFSYSRIDTLESMARIESAKLTAPIYLPGTLYT